MRSERPSSAGTARRTTSTSDEVVKTFFDGWATTEFHKTAGPAIGARRPSGRYPLAAGEGAA